MIRIGALAMVLLAAGCSGGGTADTAADPVALVSLAPAQKGSVSETTLLYGAVERGAETQYSLAAPVEGIVAEVVAPAGTRVGPGQLVIRLQPSPTTRADLAKAGADASTAAAAYARARRLRADGLASDGDVETARAAAQSASALSASLSTRSGGLALRAPGAGFVDTITANPGDIVAAGTKIATISRIGDVRARFGIEPSAAHRLSPGMVLHITPAGGKAPFDAAIQSVAPVIDPQTRLASVFVHIPPAQGIAAGQPLTAEAAIAQSSDALTVPYAALLDDGGQPYVFVVKNGVAQRHDVETGSASGDRVAILKGISPGDQVVTQGGTAIEDGMKVRTK